VLLRMKASARPAKPNEINTQRVNSDTQSKSLLAYQQCPEKHTLQHMMSGTAPTARAPYTCTLHVKPTLAYHGSKRCLLSRTSARTSQQLPAYCAPMPRYPASSPVLNFGC
jgi:hypothetical protein